MTVTRTMKLFLIAAQYAFLLPAMRRRKRRLRASQKQTPPAGGAPKPFNVPAA